MALYNEWKKIAYDSTGHGESEIWNEYLPLEEAIYKDILLNKKNVIEGKLSDISKSYKMSDEYFIGFIDGIVDILGDDFKIDEIEADSEIKIEIDFEKLFKKMVEYKAEHLYTLDEWSNVFDEKEQDKLILEQKKSSTVVKDDKPKRNDPCPCGSGLKYKRCCALND